MKKSIIAILLSITLTNVFAQNGSNIKIYPDVVYHHKDGMGLLMDIYVPENNNEKGVIFINSGGFQSPFFSKQYKEINDSLSIRNGNNYISIHKTDIQPEYSQQFSFEELLKNGYTVFDVKHSSTPKYKLNEITNDLKYAISYINKYSEKYNVSKDRIGICGGSAGGYLAAFLAANPQNENKLKTVVLYFPAGYDYLNKRNIEVRKALPSLNISNSELDSLSLKHYISNKMPPTLIMYGENDNPFITEPSDIITNELKDLGVECKKIVFENVGHIWMDKNGKYSNETGDKAMTNLIEWFDKYL
ncbi:alpha/beta hydrolase [uncultured Lutibacter sp.]|uniref:alpha/beta hydrolase n=1 Tax=uncultured Lutibacter sp. TaxID=437739 RepID=UPI002614DC7A|nr:alpha/beta hydrolase [uncultured Lutibacter sp.]